MPIVLPNCSDFPLITEVPCVRLPGGAEMCFSIPGVAPATPFEAGSQALGMINSALAPLAPFFDVLDVVQQVIEAIKAVATLNPQKIAEAIPTLINEAMDLASLFPPLSVPVFIIDVIVVTALVLDGLANELDAANSYGARLVVARELAPGVPGAAAAVSCGETHISLILQHLGGQVAPLNRLIGLLNGFMSMANIPEKHWIPCIAALDPGRIGLFVEVLRKLAAFLRALALQIPQPGGVKSRVVPC